jgi:adenine-specific DNA-methyltransferase
MNAHEGRHVMAAKDFLATFPAGSVDAIITDPPWRMGDGDALKDVADYEMADAPQIAAWLAPGLEALKPGGHAYFFAPPQAYFVPALQALLEAGWKFRQLLAWDKGNRAGLGAWRGTFEPILVMSKGTAKPFLETQRFTSCMAWERPQGRTAKPWQIYKAALEMSVPAGGLAVDPFCGLNPLRAAAESSGRRWAASDLRTEGEVWDGRNTQAAAFVRRNPKAALKKGRFVKAGQTLIGGAA